MTYNFNDIYAVVFDKTKDVSDVAYEIAGHWKYDLYARRPGPAVLENDVIKPTDLDLACFMAALIDRGAVINFPKYKARRPKISTNGERTVSVAKNRHGKLLGLVSNQNTFSNSVRIKDYTVIKKFVDGSEEVGDYRTLMITDFDGKFYDGWDEIEFDPTHQENEFIYKWELEKERKLVFEHFVHPLRKYSMFGKYYFLTKICISRLEEDFEQLNLALKEAKDKFKVPVVGSKTLIFDKSKTVKGSSKKIKVDAFESEIDAEFTGETPKVNIKNQKQFDEATTRQKSLRALLTELRFHSRAIELAFFNGGHKEMTLPFWLKQEQWETGHKLPRSPTEWNRLKLNHLNSENKEAYLRYRLWSKTETVADEEEGK